MSSMGELIFFLGLQVKQKHNGIFISQDKYVAEILKKFCLTDGKSASTPIDTEKPLLKDPDDVSEGFDQIFNFLNASSIKYALTVNPNIYVSCIKKFWSSVLVKNVNDVMRLQALVNNKKVIFTEAIIRGTLQLNDVESIDCLPNKEIFTELSRMGYEKPSTKLTFYKAFFSPQWKFLIHTILQCMSAKRTSWNEFSSSMASAIICLSTEQDKIAQSLEITKLKQRVKKLERRNKLKVSKLRRLKRVGTAQRVDTFDATVMDDVSKQGRIIANMVADKDVTLKDVADKDVANIAKEVAVDAEIEENDEVEPIELQEVVEVVTIAKLITKVVTAASATITAATTLLTSAVITTTPSAARRRKGVVIKDPEETATPSIIIHSKPKSKDKGKGILVEEPKPLKKQAQVEQDEAYARELEVKLNKNINWDDVIDQVERKDKEYNAVMRYQAQKRKPKSKAQAKKNIMIYLRNMAGFKMNYFKGMTYDDIRLIFKKKFNSNAAFLEKTRELMEEKDNIALKRTNDLAGREKISTYKVHSGLNAQQFKLMLLDNATELRLLEQSAAVG
nr:ribonuclease H-like domain-containing protein [Tanacetum cinerariifolium]